jgi:hypothetical protein
MSADASARKTGTTFRKAPWADSGVGAYSVRPGERTSFQQAEQKLNTAMQHLHCGHAKASIQLGIGDDYLLAIKTNE